MSRTSKNVLGNQRGQIGEIVGRVVDGVQLYSAHNDAVKDPRTSRQLAHRARFAAITTLGGALGGPVSVGFHNIANGVKLNSPFNIFVKANMPRATYNAGTRLAVVDYEHIVISGGNAPIVGFSNVTFTEALKASATFAPYSDTPGANDTDSVYLVVYCPDLRMSFFAASPRSAASVTVTLPTVFGGRTVHAWGFVLTSVEEPHHVESMGITLLPGTCSPSFYLGTGTVLSA